MPLPSNDELRKLLTEAAPGPWEVEELEQQRAGCPPSIGFWVSGEDARYIASEEVLSEDYNQTERDFTLIALAPQLAEEVIRLRDEIEYAIHSLRAPLCSHMPDGDELDEYLEEWEMRGYAAHILTRILEGEE
ncbi:hypothetical protein ACMF9N_001796 [Campylobacter jejuni]